MPETTGHNRSIFIGFKGSLDTHRLRKKLREALHDVAVGVYILGSNDDSLEYWQLLSTSKFALVLRGHVSFSYRFSAVVCSGAVPVLISDDWVVPFSEVFPFEHYGIRTLEVNALQMVSVLKAISEEKIAQLSHNAQRFCHQHIITPWQQFDTLMDIALTRPTNKKICKQFWTVDSSIRRD